LFYLNQGQDWQKTIYLWEERAGGGLAGWALFSPRFCAFDVFVHPDERASERARGMFAWAEERMLEIVVGQGDEQLHTMWVGQDDDWLIAHLERRSFVRSAYHLLYMTRSLEQILEPRLPPGYQVRHVMGEREARERATASHAAFQSGSAFEVYWQRVARFMASPVYTPQLDLVAVTPDGRVAAFCVCWLDEVSQVGLFEPLGTHPDWRRKGLGKAVLGEGLRRLKAQGMTSAMVCVEHDNLAAQKLYAAGGFEVASKIYTYSTDV
jgi:ribosomal protein S18 acetylase RimI-like enzyme